MAGYTVKQKQQKDREEAEEEASDHDRAIWEEKMEERVDDDVVRSRQINCQEGREAVCVCVCVCVCAHAYARLTL